MTTRSNRVWLCKEEPHLVDIGKWIPAQSHPCQSDPLEVNLMQVVNRKRLEILEQTGCSLRIWISHTHPNKTSRLLDLCRTFLANLMRFLFPPSRFAIWCCQIRLLDWQNCRGGWTNRFASCRTDSTPQSPTALLHNWKTSRRETCTEHSTCSWARVLFRTFVHLFSTRTQQVDYVQMRPQMDEYF